MIRFMRDPVGYHLALAERYGDPFVLPLPGLRMVVTGRADVAREILSMGHADFDVLDIGTEFMGEYALVRLNGEAHKRARAQVGPLVMDPIRHGNGMGIALIARRVIGASAGAGAGPVRMIALAKRITLETILLSALNLTDPGKVEAFAAAFTTMQSKASFLLHFAPWLQIDLGPWSPWGRVRRARSLIDTTIGDALTAAASAPPEDAGPIGAIARAAAAATAPAEGMTALRHQIFTLLSAGHASTAQALSWAVYHAFSDSTWRGRLRAEIAGTDDPGDARGLARLPGLDAFCREILRLYPIGPVIGRKLARPMIIGGWTLEPGTVIGLSVPLAHQDNTVFAEPRRFDPDRYLKSPEAAEDGAASALRRLIPFGGGARHCLGAALGLVEMKIVLAELLMGFEVSPRDRHAPAHRLIDAVAGPASGIPVTIRRRG